MRYVAALSQVADAATFGMKITSVIYNITSLLVYYYKNFSAQSPILPGRGMTLPTSGSQITLPQLMV
jgi:hypothetical protein